ncbi:MAG TPA: HNH/ENDO VII family nuclease, partial [Pseudomonas sp.]
TDEERNILLDFQSRNYDDDFTARVAEMQAVGAIATSVIIPAGAALRRPPGTTENVPKVTAKETEAVADVGSVFNQQRHFWSKEPIQFNGNKVYQRNDLFEPNLVSSWREGGKVVTGTNLERMASGRAPIGIDGKSVNLHHTTQTQSGPIAEMTQTFHQQNNSIIHVNPNAIPSGIDRAAFDKWKIKYWQQRAAGYGGIQ